MSSPSNSELRLKIADNIANTLLNFIAHDKESADQSAEAVMTAEDIAEDILETLVLATRDGLDADGSIVATIFAIPPEWQ